MKYVEFCAGMGGTRAGLDAAGWECTLAIDNDPDAVDVHRLAHNHATLADLSQLQAQDVPESPVWVAGFPCQPFSSSGNRLGFRHGSGHVFEELLRLVAVRRPEVLLFENVQGLLSNKGGHTFATILLRLNELGYSVQWMVMDLRWFKVPQSRPRLFIVATNKAQTRRDPCKLTHNLDRGEKRGPPAIYRKFLEDGGFKWRARSQGDLKKVEWTTRPKIGKAASKPPYIFGSLGFTADDGFVSFDLKAPSIKPPAGALGLIVAPEFQSNEDIRSARYWSPKAGGGVRGLHVRDEPISHCVGTSLGGAPLFAIPASMVSNVSQRRKFLEYANWHREQDGLLVMRLTPERASLLFGPNTCALSEALCNWDAGATRKAKLVGNMVAPICAFEIAKMIEKNID